MVRGRQGTGMVDDAYAIGGEKGGTVGDEADV